MTASSRPNNLDTLEDQGNNRNTSHQNFGGLNIKHNPDRAARVNTRQLSFADETEDNFDEEYEVNPCEYRGSYTRYAVPDILEQQKKLLHQKQREMATMRAELASLKR